MQELIVWTKETLDDKSFHPLIVVGVFNVVFLAIHPFQDGNGRLSRVLTTLLLLKSGYSYLPYSSFESIIENNKESYYLNLRRTQKTLKTDTPDWQPWIRFFLHALKRQKDHLAQKTEVSNSYDDLPIESITILDFVTKNQRITMKQAEEITKIPRPTVKTRIVALVERGFLVKHGKARGTWYSRS